MSYFSISSSIPPMLHTSNIIWQRVSLTDELKINLEYDIHNSVLNIVVTNTGLNGDLPCHINVLSKQLQDCESMSSRTDNSLRIYSDIQQDLTDIASDTETNKPEIYFELSTNYVYDIIDENDNENADQINLNQTIIPSLSSSSLSCFDEQTTDTDDGYSTHSLDDIDHHSQCPVISSPKSIVPLLSLSRANHYCEQYVSPVQQLIEQLTWLNPFKKTVQSMMMNHMFDQFTCISSVTRK